MLTALTLLFAPEDRHQLTVQNHCGAARVHMGGCCLTSHPNQHQSSAVVLLQQSANWSAMIKRSTTTLNAAALEPACLPRYCGRRRVGLRGAPTICHGFEAAARIDAQFKPSYPLLAAGASGTDLARAFGDDAAALPFTVVLGADGRVVTSHLGQVDAATLERWLAPFVSPRVARNSQP